MNAPALQAITTANSEHATMKKKNAQPGQAGSSAKEQRQFTEITNPRQPRVRHALVFGPHPHDETNHFAGRPNPQRNRAMTRSRFRRDRVPSVAKLLALLSIETTKPNGSGYAQVRCPLHGEKNPSLSIHLERGHWRCFACGETGGDALELYRRTRGLSFAQAARELGAWEGK
jgi:hypothetical protein